MKMRKHMRVSKVAVSLLIAMSLAMSLAVNPVIAGEVTNKRREWHDWDGTQVPNMPLAPISGMPLTHLREIRIAGNYVKIYGQIVMVTVDGYIFNVDGQPLWVAYEVIHYIKIRVPKGVLSELREMLSDCSDPNDLLTDWDALSIFMQMFYQYPRSGWFTWHTPNGQIKGRGTFRSDGLEGQLWFRGPTLLVIGSFQPVDWYIWHAGSYTVTKIT